MTFSELRTLVREQIIVDDYADAYLDADIDNVLWQSSVEIAGALDIPQATDTVAGVAADATTVTAPTDCAKVHTVVLAGDDAVPVDANRVLRMQQGTARPIRYFNFDPRRGGDILIAPPSVGGTATLIYTQILARPTAGAAFDAAEPWEGVLPQFHSLVAYRAAVPLFQMDERENEVEHWRVEYNTRATEMAAFLGRTDMASLLIEPQQRNDRGAAS